jgi:excisionase family DNA binding protein
MTNIGLDQPMVLTIREVATTLRCTEETVRNLVKTGELHAARLGPRGDYRIPRVSLDRFLDGG